MGMNEDKFVEWKERKDFEDLVREFLEEKELVEEFDAWMYEEYVNELSVVDDIIHDERRFKDESQ